MGVLTGFLIGLGLAASAASAEEPAAPPKSVDRVLLITVDTLRADHVGAYGGSVPTPAIDRLAAEGVLVEQACTPIPSTGPAHASLLTGLHPWRHRTLRNAAPMGPTIPRLSERAREHGLETAAFVSSYMLHRRFGFDEGFDTFVFEPDQEYMWRGKQRTEFWSRGATTTRAALHWITKMKEHPFLLWVHYFDPHTPYQPPPGYARSPQEPVDLTGKSVPKEVPSRRKLKRLIRAYRGEVAYVDAQVGKLVDRLRFLGLLDRTAVILTSDHGEGLGDHGVLEHGTTLFDELVRVPLVIRAPGLPPGRRLAGDAQLEDLAPTILSLIGADPIDDVDGVDLLPWLRGDVADSPRRAVLGRRRRFKGTADLYFMRSWPTKWIGALERPGKLYQLDEDLRERHAGEGSGAPKELTSSVAPHQQTAPGDAPDADPEVRQALEALGYLE